MVHNVVYRRKAIYNDIIISTKLEHCYVVEDISGKLGAKKNHSVDFKIPFSFFSQNENRFIYHLEEHDDILHKAPEILFEPVSFIEGSSSSSKNFCGVQELLTRSILRCPSKYRSEILKNIIVCGGTSKMKGFPQRIENYMKHKFPNDEVRVNASEKREASEFYGAQKLLRDMLSQDFPNIFIKKKEVEEYGSTGIIKRKLSGLSFCPVEDEVVWEESNHYFHDRVFRKLVFTVLCCSELRKECLLYHLPKEVLMIVFSFLSRSEETNEELRRKFQFLKVSSNLKELFHHLLFYKN